MQSSKVGISFAGGGLKSFAHVVVTQDLEAHLVDIQAVSGTSMGSVIASLYACGFIGKALEDKLLELEVEIAKRKILLRPSLRILPFVKDRSDGLIEQKIFESFVRESFEEIGITMLSEIELPLCITATDLITGDSILFCNKPEFFKPSGINCRFYDKDIEIWKAVTSSCAFPLVFQSVEIDDLRLVDGGVLLNNPSSVFNRHKIEKVIGISTMDDLEAEIDYSLIGVGTRSLILMMNQIEKQSDIECDLLVNFPTDMRLIFEVGKGKEIIERARDFLIEHPIDYDVLKPKRDISNLWGLLK